MAAVVRGHDWSGTPLGSIDQWDASLRIAVSTALDSPIPTIVLWGSDLLQIYNDAYRPILGLRHPAAMGQPTQACWPEVWHFNEPIYHRVMDTGQPVHLEDQAYVIEPSGVRETRYFTITYAPLRDENALVRGVVVVAIETTRRVHAERDNITLQEKTRAAADQQAFQLQLADRIRSLDTPEEVAAAACELLGERLGIWRVIFCEIDDTRGTFFIRSEWARDGFFSVAGKSNRLDDFGPENIAALRAGKVVVHNDIAIDTRTTAHRQAYEGFGIRANLAIPVLKSGALRVVLGLHHVEPYEWSPADISVATDVAERTWAAVESARVHAELRAERDQSQYILDGMTEGFALIDSDWRMTQMNVAGLRAGHRLLENVIGFPIWETWPEIIGTDIEAMYRRVMASHVAENMESPLTFSDGQTSFLEITMYPALAGGVAVFFRDVSERKQAVEALDISRLRAEHALSIAQLGTYDWNIHTNEVESSARSREIFCFTDEEGHIAEDFFGRIVAEDVSRVREDVASAMQSDGRLEIEYRILLPDGRRRDVIVAGAGQRGSDGAWARQVGVISDATARKQDEEKLREADRRKDEFLAMLAHELRNPLAPITMAARILSRPGIEQQTLQEMSNIVIRQAEHMTSLIEDLLDVSRINKGLVTLDNEALNLKGVVASAVEQARALMEKQRHDFSVSVCGEEIRVEGDRVRLVQILTNILNNAAKYTPAGGKIVLELTATEKHAQVTIIDNGIGMSQELLPYIFDIFTQAERTSDRVQGGLGLGLSLVKNLVALHGGTVMAKSAGIGLGSEFTVCLPLLKDPAQSKNLATHASVGPTTLPTMCIMVVDDNVDAAKTLAMFLELDGHSVAVAHTAEDALARLHAAMSPAPQAFLLDIGLPGMDGYELARQLRAMPVVATAVLIALTGYGQPQDRERSSAAGFNHHLEKPVDPEALMALLNRL